MSNIAYIDNKPFPVTDGETILEFVRRNRGRDLIPTLCQADNLENYGSCRICSVEVALKENGPSRIMASCHTPVTPGHYIYPSTDRITRLRRNIIELVLSEYPEASVTPDAGMLPTEFQSVVATTGVSHVRYPVSVAKHEKDMSHPYVWSDLSECIKCYRCVTVCEEIRVSSTGTSCPPIERAPRRRARPDRIEQRPVALGNVVAQRKRRARLEPDGDQHPIVLVIARR
ncbi:MAG: 2Fe-2S iron-sulfur cluster-binding protein [Bacteroidales bacterium]|nr:2Fe-2S iron-sulfur cluster-binding protein [Bacteroidales bacterium]